MQGEEEVMAARMKASGFEVTEFSRKGVKFLSAKGSDLKLGWKEWLVFDELLQNQAMFKAADTATEQQVSGLKDMAKFWEKLGCQAFYGKPWESMKLKARNEWVGMEAACVWIRDFATFTKWKS